MKLHPRQRAAAMDEKAAAGKYKFKRVDWKFDRLLICPNCFETLCRDDIEHFTKCPYCDFRFEFDCPEEREVELVAELRSDEGEGWFDTRSLQLRRIP